MPHLGLIMHRLPQGDLCLCHSHSNNILAFLCIWGVILRQACAQSRGLFPQ